MYVCILVDHSTSSTVFSTLGWDALRMGGEGRQAGQALAGHWQGTRSNSQALGRHLGQGVMPCDVVVVACFLPVSLDKGCLADQRRTRAVGAELAMGWRARATLSLALSFAILENWTAEQHASLPPRGQPGPGHRLKAAAHLEGAQVEPASADKCVV